VALLRCSIRFDDLHDSGIYTYSYLHSLGSSKLAKMRQYIRQLRQAGLSREPRRRG
jgi:DUF971 family protein